MVLNASIQPHWADGDRYLWYRRERLEITTDAVSNEFVLIDTRSATRQVFATQEGLDRAMGIETGGGGKSDRGDGPRRVTSFEASPRRSTDTGEDTSIRFINELDSPIELFWIDAAARSTSYGKIEANQSRDQHTFAGHLWMIKNARGDVLGYVRGEADPLEAVFDKSVPVMEPGRSQRPNRRRDTSSSPDGNWSAEIKRGQVEVRRGHNGDESGEAIVLTNDGTETDPYEILQWSPDSSSLVVARVHPVKTEEVYRIESSPESGGRALLQSNPYLLPGDPMTRYDLVVLPVASEETQRKKFSPLEEPFDFGRPRIRWIDDHRFTVEKVDRGHQRFRIFGVDTHSGSSRTIVDETSDTFVWTMHGPPIPMTSYLEESRELIYASERSGWRHLYLVDLEANETMRPITSGPWVVRSIERIDETKRQVWFAASGKNSDADPYLLHHYRINFDGTELVELTAGDGTHSLQFSPTGEFYIDTFSRVDAAPASELRRSMDGSLVWKLETADTTRLISSGWNPPEVFSAKGRDGVTNIWGFIARPRDFDATKKYPVIEYIYAGPHDSHVPKSFQATDWYRTLTDLGFIVVRIDGMGTANRSKAFHDVCWHNLKDAGFPDRIEWMKAAAQSRPYMDLDRVGIYGTSAGGQNAVGALLFHGDFYKAAAAFCGCHDNRMDKASWNEQWMGYPVGPHYADSSNIEHASQLQGHLFLMVGELDTNVPPESTMRLADALINADKNFEMLVMPGVGHSDGGKYGQERMRDFFQRHLQGIDAKRVGNDDVLKSGSNAANGAQPTPATPEPDPPLASWDGPNRAATLTTHFKADLGSLERFYNVSFSPTRIDRLRRFLKTWCGELQRLETDDFTKAESASLDDLHQLISERSAALDKASDDYEQLCQVAPFAKQVIELVESKQRVDGIEPRRAAQICDELIEPISHASMELAKRLESDKKADRETLISIAASIRELDRHLSKWYSFYHEYDPMFTWWVQAPYESANQAIDDLIKVLPEPQRKSPGQGRDRSDSVELLCYNHDGSKSQATGTSPGFAEMLRYQPGHIAGLIVSYQQRLQDARRQSERSKSGDVQGNGVLAVCESTLRTLESIDFETLDRAERVDWLLLRTELRDRIAKAKLPAREDRSIALAPDPADLLGTPVGREVIDLDLNAAMIAYTPDELIQIGEREAAWCRSELLKASAEMGYGNDWKAAVEHVKMLHVEPGQQPSMIRDLAVDSIATLRAGDWISIPPIAEETYRMEMMSPERQLVNPFFLGGEVITVSYPTSTMKHQDKLQSMRGNNRMFARATVHHEVIPGHHLQGFMTDRYYPHRKRFYTPFWGEGWAVYWEMLLYERGFARTPEERIGFLVWRSHRCARILFSLSFHLGRMTPNECVDLLVENVGFDRNNAAAEVRRSIGTAYSPLYQAGYMLGALQLRELHREIVDGGMMSEREFHDAVLRQNYMPIELLRATLTNAPIEKDFQATWKFYPLRR